VLNPDVYFDKHVITELVNFMEAKPAIGLLMPKVLYPDGRLQPLCKLLPQPHEILVRRFLSGVKGLHQKVNYHYEMQFTGYDRVTEVPFLSGCFMLLRTEVLEKVGLFDERFFLYFEDTDLSRRIHQHSQTMYYPGVEVFHYHESGLHKKQKNLWFGFKSAIQYFNKWGWYNDPIREEINKKVLIHHRVNGYSKQIQH
jgi:GT2 family glycosyltransferase